MWSIVYVSFVQNTILNSEDRSNNVRYMTKTRQDNDLIDHTSMLYVENETELSWLIR